MSTPSHRKEICPSTHRLPNNTTESPEMSTFLGDGASQPLPEVASNYTDPTWSSSRHVDGGDHVVGLCGRRSMVEMRVSAEGGGPRVIKSDGDFNASDFGEKVRRTMVKCGRRPWHDLKKCGAQQESAADLQTSA
ncbi:hypothetical protein Tco_0674671 [Tanacetum coccineum]